ncbi:hypothetical protein M9Y10_030484 [Tritrichomonas musculus]|uniref:MSP domain-containing protein n=1 Tax=Tritrichomonas musculus TaxID=1915356 RepID=A0ABR2H4D8_9EUKA
MYGLTIHLQSFQINDDIIRGKDKVHVSVFTIPGNNKQTYAIDPKKMNNPNCFFKLNVTNQTKRLLFIFEKRNLFQNDPIIASAVINSSKMPNSPLDSNNIEIKTFDIFEPIISQYDCLPKKAPEKVGQMKIQFSLSEQSFIKTKKNPSRSNKKPKCDYYSQVDPCINERRSNNCILLDEYYVN